MDGPPIEYAAERLRTVKSLSLKIATIPIFEYQASRRGYELAQEYRHLTDRRTRGVDLEKSALDPFEASFHCIIPVCFGSYPKRMRFSRQHISSPIPQLSRRWPYKFENCFS